MVQNMVIGPTHVSFYQVDITEIGRDAIDRTGFFVTIEAPSHIGNGADSDIHLRSDNSWDDEAFIQFDPITLYPGAFTWPIPAVWFMRGDSSKHSMPGWNQVFTILDNNGT